MKNLYNVRKMSNGKSNFFIRKTVLVNFVLGILEDFVCNTLKFEKVMLDYNDQCHGWWATAQVSWVPGQG